MSNLTRDIIERRRANYARRILELRKALGIKWSRRESFEFLDRITHASCEDGVNDVDLRVLVRMFNRELIGRKNEA